MARNFNYTKIEWQDGTILQPAKVTVQGTEYEVEPEVKSGQTPIDAINLDKMDSAIETIIEEELPSVINVELLAVTDVAPSECSTGDKYYNTEDKKIYTATGEDTWSSTGETPLDGILYVLFDARNTFAWDGEDLISVGGGGGVYVGTEPPEDDNVNFWVNPDDNAPYPDFAEMSVDKLNAEDIEVENIESKNLLPAESSFTVTNTQRSRTVTGLNLKANQEYMLSCTNITSDNTYQYLFFFNVGQSSQFSVYLSNTQYYATFTPTVDVNSVAIYSSNAYNSSGNYTTTYTNLMIEKGDTVTDYTPYKAFDSTAYVLWSNSSPTADFTAQTITLNDAIEKYKYYEVIFKQATSVNRFRSSGKIQVGLQTELQDCGPSLKRRPITAMSGTSMTISNGSYYATYGSGTDTGNNSVIIPYQILGYK